jgi:hypothetical protein
MGLVFAGILGTAVHSICIVLHFHFSSDIPSLRRSAPQTSTKSLLVIRLCGSAGTIAGLGGFGAASASLHCNKEAANSSNMTFSLFDSSRHYPSRSGCRNDFHRLS